MLLYYDHQQTMTGFNRLLTRISLMRMIQSHLTMSSNFVKKSTYRSVNDTPLSSVFSQEVFKTILLVYAISP